MTELQILNAVKNNGGSIDFVELLNLGLTDPTPNHIADAHLIKDMIAAKVLSGKAEAYSLITFGKEGHLRLRDLQQAADDLANHVANEHTEKNTEARFQTSQTLLGAALGAAFTLLIEILINVLFG